MHSLDHIKNSKFFFQESKITYKLDYINVIIYV